MEESTEVLTFAVPFLDNYSRMAQALANSIRYFHPNGEILAMTTAPAGPQVREVSRLHYDDLVEYEDLGFAHAGYTPVVWTRLHLWNLPTTNTVVCLDADIQMYRPLPDSVVREYRSSRKVFGSILDGMPLLEQQFCSGYEAIGRWNSAPAACVAYLILQPNPSVGGDLIELTMAHEGFVVCPEQAILNLYAAQNGGWLDQSAATVTQSWSPEVLSDPPLTPFVHFGSPRPDFFGPSPLRQGDVEYQVALRSFERRTGKPFPVDRIGREFQTRLDDSLNEEFIYRGGRRDDG